MRYLVDCSNYFGDNYNLGDVAIFTIMIRRIHAMDSLAEIRWITRNSPKMHELFGNKITCIDVADTLERDYFCGASSRVYDEDDRCSVSANEEAQVTFLLNKSFQEIHEKHRPIIESIAWADVILASGGGYFSDAFPQHAIGVLDTLAGGWLTRKTIALLGIGFEKLSHERLVAKSRAILPRLNIIGCRESVFSPNFLETMGCSTQQLILTGDDAVELAYDSRVLTFGEGLGVNLRKAAYSNVSDSATAWLADLVKTFATRNRVPLYPIPISIYGPSDLQSIQEIIGKLDAAEGPDSTEKLFQQIAKCRLLLTGSYHAAVFALSQGIPVLALANSLHYDTKLSGLMHRFGGKGGRVIQLSAPDAAESICNGLEEFWEKAPQFREDLLRQAAAQAELGNETYRQLATLASSGQSVI